ncbi:3-dehydroquinate synthase [Allomuricauda sp. SCSIO 65647]|uniref:3-dehydroquinate synthase n=1 Tax=Allomuricauda sp. SCSIO 65647 TaxID=2908843 RepID=UPI001F367D88|nr:3-dehydroquinate synthase [Muricauda sp. SCSIO 65647]UJH67219.1 3-dehydroquinate synthase [Muricauda sp. SCSIO 65647]
MNDNDIYYNELAQAALKLHLGKMNYSKVFILVDTNTKKYCLPVFTSFFSEVSPDGIFVINAGEENKNINTCARLWDDLSNAGGDRKSLLINLGGGVVTDLGGFVASTFKRGIDFINIPTTLLAMVDASIGGKTGVDLGALKNQIGVIKQPEMILVFTDFLNTLDKRQVNSGFAEMLKHGLIKDGDYWKVLKNCNSFQTKDLIERSALLKSHVVQEDPDERGLRKILNFGHTAGHAIESYFLENPDKETLLHGEAIAVGMVIEAYFSHQLTGLSKLELKEIKETFAKYFKKVDFDKDDIDTINALLRHDKKNTHGNINYVLLKTIGKAVTDIKVPDNLFAQAFTYYKEA